MPQPTANEELPDYPDRLQQGVALFHRAFGLPDLIGSPGPLPLGRVELRLSLIEEEGFHEMSEAIAASDEVAVADALVDTLYVALGTLVEMGRPYVQDAPIVRRLTPRSLVDPARDMPGRVANSVELLRLSMAASDADATAERLSLIVSLVLRSFAEAGIDIEPYFDEVQRANMSKLGADGQPVRSRGPELDGAPEGKVLKGPAYSPPDLVTVHVVQTGRTHELDRMSAVSEESQAIGAFIDTAGYTLAEWVSEYEGDDGRVYEYMNGPQLRPVGRAINTVLAEYFKIDLDRVETERRALLRLMAERRS